MKLEDLPPALQAQARAQLGQIAREVLSAPDRPDSQPKPRQPSKTELAWFHEKAEPALQANELISARYEALSFRLANGHRYTPDFVCEDAHGKLICVEVKGSYRLGSYQRARLAFDQARLEWPAIRWIWAERQKDGSWRTV